MAKILVVDDERSVRDSIKDVLEYEKHEVLLAENGKEAIDMIKYHNFDLMFCDIKMPKMDGNEVLERVRIMIPELPVIMISGHGNIDSAVKCIKMGAFDYIEKPPEYSRILVSVKNALEKKSLETETKTLRKKVASKYQMIGNSKEINHVKDLIERVAPTDARVLIIGANGTGKEVVAHWLHEKSNRNKAPFVEVNCAAIPSELIESELFGHEKGSFTSAHKQRIGKFEQAHGGTLFLDEIGDMSLSAQAKVLRALQENKISRVGSDKDINVDVRVIAATNKDLSQEIDEKKFREDLYHRLSVIVIRVPKLNERIEDIPLLAEHFIEQACIEQGIAKKTISEDAIEALKNIKWTGNIREFRNVIERMVILGSKTISAKDVETYAFTLR
ncbi:MAG TPA: sigma-54 dependent transcriptional regulator [Bacteroidales bacterium]|jgi:DNA-binding NtrC family response regulator|nr:sigma-54 dependent transcriptional regulator [Bacteroidales bacterium]HRW20493.1 sigma-54 dependent transcriptional regulator [Bacteroidales bacterium]HXK80722.1 sigma-54 dependent transcriptional regulator [Bacteroidales bacterium]